MAKVALIFGATGIVGSAIAEELANTSPQEWKKIIITSRRQPILEAKDPRIHFVSIDLEGESEEGIKKKLKEAGAEETTHVYFTAYIHSKTWDGVELCKRNTPIFVKSIKAVDALAPHLQKIVLQLGVKYYGAHLGPLKGPFPIHESQGRHADVPTNPDFYFEQEDFLKEFQKGKKWTYISTLADIILGVTRGNGMSLAPTLALYFLVQKELGKKAIFPGKPVTYKANSDTTNADLLAQFSILASTNPNVGNDIFNIIDHNTIHQKWDVQWKAFGDYFGVEVEAPTENSVFKLEDYMKNKQEAWNSYAKKHGGDPALWDYATWDFADAMFGFTYDNGPFDLSKAQKIGWKTEITPIESFTRVFDKLKHLKMIA